MNYTCECNACGETFTLAGTEDRDEIVLDDDACCEECASTDFDIIDAEEAFDEDMVEEAN
jgi:Zn finger protein HypA/HybF involved in hydrogenase expression